MLLLCSALLALVSVSQTAKDLPPYIKPCAPKDPGFKECTLKNGNEAIIPITNGDRKFKVPVFDPMEIIEIKVNSGPQQAGLQLVMRDVKLYGLRDAVLDDTDFNFGEKRVKLHFHCPKNTLIGKYTVKGRVLLLPVSGQGDFNITMVDNILKFSIDYNIVEEEGREYFRSTNQDAILEPTKTYLHFDNLFNGDKLLGAQLNQILNDNWKVLFKDFGPPISGVVGQAIGAVVDKVAFNVPLDVAFIGGIPHS